MTDVNQEAAVEAVEAATEQGPTTSVEPVQLSIQDLQMLANVVDLASRRGAFHAKEMETVGATFNRLSTFIDHVVAQNEPTEGNEASVEQAADVSAAE